MGDPPSNKWLLRYTVSGQQADLPAQRARNHLDRWKAGHHKNEWPGRLAFEPSKGVRHEEQNRGDADSEFSPGGIR